MDKTTGELPAGNAMESHSFPLGENTSVLQLFSSKVTAQFELLRDGNFQNKPIFPPCVCTICLSNLNRQIKKKKKRHSSPRPHKSISIQPFLIPDWPVRVEEQTGKPPSWGVQGSPQPCSSEFLQSGPTCPPHTTFLQNKQ